MSESLSQRIDAALRRVHNARVGADVATAEMVKDVATTTDGKVRLTLVLDPEDDAMLVRDVRQAVERIDGVTGVRVDVMDPRQYEAARADKRAAARALPVMDAAPARAPQPSAPQPASYPGLGKILAISSGKGGVGKSTVAVNLAVALAKAGKRVGIMDADVYGPNLPRMLGVDAPPAVRDEKIQPLEAHGVKVMSIGFMIERDQPAIWRGPIVMKVITQFLRDVAWGQLDYLLVDMPPGTGDAQLSLVQAAQIHGGVIVTTPQQVAVGDALRGVKMFERVNVPVLGIVENMSYLENPETGKPIAIFGSGGGAQLATEVGAPLLGQVPIDPRIVEGGDTGRPIVAAEPTSAAARALTAIAQQVAERARLSDAARADPRLPIDERDGGVPVALVDGPALVHEPLGRLVVRVALPAVVSNLLMTLFLAVDAFWVGTRLGATSLAAVTTSVFWVWMGISVAEMVSIGLTAVAARRHGEGQRDVAARAAGDALLLTLGLGVVAAVAGRLGVDWMFAVMQTPIDVAAAGRTYLSLYVLAAPVLYGYFVVDATFRAAGDTRTPLLILAASIAVALVLDPILILGLGGAPRLGIAGAAVATVSSRSIAFVVGLVVLRRRRLLALGTPRPRVMGTIARVGLPTAATGVLFSVVYVVVARTASRFGTDALAALGLGFRVESWLYMLGVGFGAAAAAIVGQNLGAGREERAVRAGWTMLAAASVPALAAAAISFLLPERAAGLFTHDAGVIAETASYLRIAALSQLVVCAEVVFEGALGGAGYTVLPMVTSTTLTAARIPLAIWTARFGVIGLWWTISATATARGLAMMGIWRWGRWRKARV